MPIPFIIAGVVAAGGAIIGGAAKAVNDDYERELNTINNKIERLIEDTEKSYKNTVNEAKNTMRIVSNLKTIVFENSLLRFANSFSKLKNVEINTNQDLEKNLLIEMKEFAIKFKNNSTNRQIPTNYDILSKQGAVMGMLFGGTYLVGSLFKGIKLQYAIDEAKANYNRVKAEAEAIKTKETGLKKIINRGKEVENVLNSINGRFKLALNEFEKNITKYGVDYGKYPKQVRTQVYITTQFAQVAKILVEAPIVDSRGNLSNKTREAINKANTVLDKLAQIERGVYSETTK